MIEADVSSNRLALRHCKFVIELTHSMIERYF